MDWTHMTPSTTVNPLSGQVAVVTGAGSGIGRAIALAIGARGATLALVGRRAGLLKTVSEEARSCGATARIYQADLSRSQDIHDLAGRLGPEMEFVDILVHCAAIHLRGPVAKAPENEFDVHYRTNLLGPYLLTQELLPLLLPRRGQIVFMNSSAGLTARADIGQFAATKHALKAVADSLRDEVNPSGVRVLSVFPGRTASPNQERVCALEGRHYRPDRLLQPEDIAAVVVNALCLPRTAEVTEIKIRPMLKFD